MVTDVPEIKKIGVTDFPLLEAFISGAGSSLTSFRYFDKRPYTVICNHVVTALIILGDRPVGYGHLDKDNEIVWLGIAISEGKQRTGLGKMMMDFLTETADKMQFPELQLTVDRNNPSAIALYKKYGFNETAASAEYYLHMSRALH